MPIGTSDGIADFLSHYATSSLVQTTEASKERLKTILIDSFAVALAALKHPAALAVRRYASDFVSAQAPCAMWGTSRRANAEVAALGNGVLLRCYDYNDLYIGQQSWGHPSDIIAAVLAVAERRRVSGASLLEALALGYDVTLALFDAMPAAAVGWDYCNLTAIGAVCAGGRLTGLSPLQTREALSIAVMPHFASDEIESGDLNPRGDLTMWKRFNSGDAMRQAVYACDLARAGAEGAVRPFEGKFGFLNKLGASADAMAVLRRSSAIARGLTASCSSAGRLDRGPRARFRPRSTRAAKRGISRTLPPFACRQPTPCSSTWYAAGRRPGHRSRARRPTTPCRISSPARCSMDGSAPTAFRRSALAIRRGGPSSAKWT